MAASVRKLCRHRTCSPTLLPSWGCARPGLAGLCHEPGSGTPGKLLPKLLQHPVGWHGESSSALMQGRSRGDTGGGAERNDRKSCAWPCWLQPPSAALPGCSAACCTSSCTCSTAPAQAVQGSGQSSAGAVGTSPPAPAAGTAEGATGPFHCSPARAGLSALPTHPLPRAVPTMGAARQEPLHGSTKADTASADGAFSPWAERGTFPAGSERSRALGRRTAGFGSLEMVVTPAEIAKMGLQVRVWRGWPCRGAVRCPGSRYLRLAAGRSPGHRPSHCPISRGCGPWPVSAQARFPSSCQRAD